MLRGDVDAIITIVSVQCDRGLVARGAQADVLGDTMGRFEARCMPASLTG